MLNGEPEYRWRRRQEAEKNENQANREWDKATQDTNIRKIITSIDRIVEYLDRAEDEHSPKNQDDRRWKRREVLGLWAAAAVGVGAVWFGNHDATEQRIVMQGQLDEMAESKRNSDRSANEQLAALKAQVNAMKAEMELTERPWVHIKNIEFTAPILFNETGIIISINMIIENIGHYPAMNIWRDIGAMPMPINANPADEQKKICDARKAKAVGADGHGFDLFPGDNTILPLTFTISRQEIEKIRSMPIQTNIGFDSLGFAIYIYGCIDYGFTFSDGHHQTPFIHEIDKIAPAPKKGFVHFTMDESAVPAAALIMLDNPYLAGRTD